MSSRLVKEESLTAIGDAIRDKTGATGLLSFPTGMVNEIGTIEGAPKSLVVYEGYSEKTFQKEEIVKRFLNEYGDRITTKNLISLAYWFEDNTVLEEIPFDLNFIPLTGYNMFIPIGWAFSGCTKLKSIPNFNGENINPVGIGVFYDCWSLEYLPDGFGDNWDWTTIHGLDYTGMIFTPTYSEFFYNCYSLRYVPENFIKNLYTSYGHHLANLFYNCQSIDSILGLYPDTDEYGFLQVFYNNYRINRATFQKTSKGTPYICPYWEKVVLDLTHAGYFETSPITNSTITWITNDTYQISDDSTYKKLKNNINSWTMDINYSRYNKTSAIETIDSLPDVSSSGFTNTIKFTGAAGAKTDGGAINTLTTSQIAVATAKGWTITFA